MRSALLLIAWIAAAGSVAASPGCARTGMTPPQGETGAGGTAPIVVSAEATAPGSAVSPAPPRAHPAAMTMHALVSHGYGCGGHCAFNWRGDSTVELTFGGEGRASVSDRGDATQSRAGPDGYATTKQTWAFTWAGAWTGDATRRTLELERITSWCNVSVEERNANAKADCVAAPERWRLVCEWGTVPQEAGLRGRANPAPSVLTAWLCRPEPASDRYPGTEFPWAIAPAPLERRVVGEPEPETTFVPWEPKAPNAAP